ncbi:MAG: amidohydrolase family protein [bacterium]
MEEALVGATFNAACSLRLQRVVGSVEVRKRADLCVFPCADYRELAYFVGLKPSAVILGGRLTSSGSHR